jgi:hypothetical protein
MGFGAVTTAVMKVSLFLCPHGTHRWASAQGAAGIARAARFLRATL